MNRRGCVVRPYHSGFPCVYNGFPFDFRVSNAKVEVLRLCGADLENLSVEQVIGLTAGSLDITALSFVPGLHFGQPDPGLNDVPNWVAGGTVSARISVSRLGRVQHCRQGILAG
jgi:hypothetical protein